MISRKLKRPTSLTLRLTLLFSAVATVVLLTFGWLIERSIEEHFMLQDIKELKIVAQAVKHTLSTLQSKPDSAPENSELERVRQRFSDMLTGHHSTLLLITDATGLRLYSNTDSDLSLIPQPISGLRQGVVQHWNNDKHNYRIFIQQVAGQNNVLYTVTVAVAIDFHLHFLKTFRYTLWLMVACGIIVMGVMGWVAVRQGHRPLHRIVEQISQTSANEFNTQLDPSTVPVELTELVLSFNELLQRMAEAFNRLSNFSADIAHELRTPITNLTTQTQVALSQSRDTHEYQEILYSNMEEYKRMAQMIGDMLFLAKADNTQHPPNTEKIELKSEIHNLFDYYGAWAEECRISLVLSGDAHVQADRLMLRRALSNLLSNAIRYTAPENRVDVKLSDTENEVIIIVQNPGNPIPEEHLEKIFDRFYRTDPSRQRSGEGAGLGLAIVKSIVEAHSGTIVAASDKRTGTQFRINLPRIVDA